MGAHPGRRIALAQLETSHGLFNLDRYPPGQPGNLRAWDAADLYLLRHLEEDPLEPGQRLLLVEDAFGALGTVLNAARPVSWSDSHIARLALAKNLAANGLSPRAVPFLPADAPPGTGFDRVLIKLPKNLAWLEDLLLRLRPALNPGARVILGGMIKHSPTRAYRLMEEIIGPAPTSQGVKKARLCLGRFDPARDLPGGVPEVRFRLDDANLDVDCQANVFSREKLDPGTHLLLQYMPQAGVVARAADLGCGAGVLALALARLFPETDILGVDESYQAVASAQANARTNGLVDRVTFQAGDGLADVPSGSLNLVLCNPPFHEGHTVGDHVSSRFIVQARAALATGGELRLVGNRHLGYHVKLKQVFGNCREVGTSSKFVVFSALKQD